MTQYFTLAGITWRVLLPEGTEPLRGGVLADFGAEAAERWDHTLHCDFCDSLPQIVGEPVFRDPGKWVYACDGGYRRYLGAVEQDLTRASLCIIRQGEHSRVLLRRERQDTRFTDKLLLNAMEAEHQIVRRDGLLLHAAWVRWKGQAILFTAPSGTGKSTQAELWCRLRGADLINGDRAAVFARPGERLQVRGIPFSGSSGVGRNAQMPLLAVVYLSQAGETTITRLGGYRAFRSIWEGCSVNLWDREDADRCAETIGRVLEQVPVYHLACTPDESAVRALQQQLEAL